MFNVTKVQNNLYGVVGTRQPLNPTYAIIDSNNQGSTSGLYVTDNPNCKVEYLYDSQDYKDLSDADFNTVLANLQKDAISNVCNKVFNKPSYIDRQVLYPYAINKVETETMPNGFVCVKIEPSTKKNLAFEITRVLLDFEGTGDLELRLFNSSKSTPIYSTTITISSDHQEEVLNWRVDNSDTTYKGEYYLGYRTNTAGIGTLKPYKRNYENSDIEACISELWTEEYYFEGHTTDTLPDLREEKGLSQTLGFNPDITVFDDYTDLITQNAFLFAKAIQLEMQIKFIENYLFTLRSNINERNANRHYLAILQTLEGETRSDSAVTVDGLKPQLLREIASINKEILKLQDGYFIDRLGIDTLT